MSPVIAHVDMDAFFASIELLRRPNLKGKPVAVGRDHARAVVAAASYEARKHGVHSALPLSIAKRRCPKLIMVPPDLALYRQISARVMSVLSDYSDRIEVAGLDEAYVDLTESPFPKSRAMGIKHDIRRAVNLPGSVGLGPNKLVAKIASDLDKPDGLAMLDADSFLPVVGAKPARIIPGVGPRTDEKLRQAGIATVADLAHADPSALASRLGSNARALVDRARGHDDRELTPRRDPKSESRERTFPDDVTSNAELRPLLAEMAREILASLEAEGFAGRTVTLKIRFPPFETHTRSKTVTDPVIDSAVLTEIASGLLEGIHSDGDPVRLIGLGIGSLSPVSLSPDRAADFPASPRQGVLPLGI